MTTFDDKHIHATIDKLILDFNIDAEILFNGIPKSRIRSREYTALELFQISKNLNVNATDLATGDFSMEHVAKSFRADIDCFAPDHFLGCAYSSTTSLNTLLSEAEKFGRRDYLLRKLQINESYLTEHRPLSVLATQRALKEMTPFFGLEALRALGVENARKFCAGPFGEQMRINPSASNAMELFVHHSQLIEKNWTYKILSRNLSTFIVETKESELVKDFHMGVPFTNNQLNTWRWSFFEEVIRLKTGRDVTCKEIVADADSAVVEVAIS